MPGGAPARLPPHAVVEEPARGQAALRRLHRRRSRHHGGGQPRRLRGQGPQHRPVDRAAARGSGQPAHHARAAVPLPLLLHAQVLARLHGQGDDRVSRRLRHLRRAVRGADAGADEEDDQADADGAVRHGILEGSGQLRRHGEARHHQPGGRRTWSTAPIRWTTPTTGSCRCSPSTRSTTRARRSRKPHRANPVFDVAASGTTSSRSGSSAARSRRSPFPARRRSSGIPAACARGRRRPACRWR